MERLIEVKTSRDLSAVRDLVREEIIPYELEQPDSQVFTDRFLRKLHSMNILQAITPKRLGGDYWTVIDLCCLIREISYGSASQAASVIGNLLGYSAMVLYGRPALRKAICEDTNQNFRIWSFAMTEQDIGSDLKNIKTTAVETENGFVINGEKNFITNGSFSDHISVFAQTIGRNGKDLGVSCFYVPGHLSGVTRTRPMNKIAWKKANTAGICFDNVLVPSEHILGQVGQGLRILTHCLNRSKTLLGAMGVGIADRAIDLSFQRLVGTQRYGKPLMELKVLQHLLGGLVTQKEAAWLLTCNAAATWDSSKPAVKEASMAKYFSGKMCVQVTNECVEMFGARGLFNDYEISRLHRDAKGIDIIEGPSMIQELLIASRTFPIRKTAKNNIFHLTARDFEKVV